MKVAFLMKLAFGCCSDAMEIARHMIKQFAMVKPWH
jgi:hypothetical protein